MANVSLRAEASLSPRAAASSSLTAPPPTLLAPDERLATAPTREDGHVLKPCLIERVCGFYGAPLTAGLCSKCFRMRNISGLSLLPASLEPQGGELSHLLWSQRVASVRMVLSLPDGYTIPRAAGLLPRLGQDFRSRGWQGRDALRAVHDASLRGVHSRSQRLAPRRSSCDDRPCETCPVVVGPAEYRKEVQSYHSSRC